MLFLFYAFISLLTFNVESAKSVPSTSSGPDQLSSMPPEIQSIIMSKLNAKDFLALGMTSKENRMNQKKYLEVLVRLLQEKANNHDTLRTLLKGFKKFEDITKLSLAINQLTNPSQVECSILSIAWEDMGGFGDRFKNPADCCDPEGGITCNAQRRIIQIIWIDEGLHRAISPLLGIFSYLEEL